MLDRKMETDSTMSKDSLIKETGSIEPKLSMLELVQETRDDLSNQIKYLRERYPHHELIEDVGSGLNFKRKGFVRVLDRIMSGDIAEIVITHRDRWCRFGFQIFEHIAEQNNCKFVVLDNTQLSPQEELVKDLVSIIHVFSCRIYGLRKYSDKIKKDQDIPK
jgi:putative resolvase